MKLLAGPVHNTMAFFFIQLWQLGIYIESSRLYYGKLRQQDSETHSFHAMLTNTLLINYSLIS
jgi:hypothetical protein